MIKIIAFDLDDTLLDTSLLLVPPAAKESCDAMISAGLKGNLEEVLAARGKFIQDFPRKDVFQFLVEKFGMAESCNAKTIMDAGSKAFFYRRVPEQLEPLAEARELLTKLAPVYHLALVTAGDPQTQRAKVEALQIHHHFAEIHFVDPTQGQKKQHAFSKIMRARPAERPENFLSVGNRVDSDIAEAKQLGWQTCWFKHGEYRHMLPANEYEKPDYEITELRELIPTCHL